MSKTSKRPRKQQARKRRKPSSTPALSADTLPRNPDAHLDEHGAAAFLGTKVTWMRKQRMIGGGPPFVRMTARTVRYRLGDLQDYSRARRYDSTASYPDAGGDAVGPVAVAVHADAAQK